MNIRLWILQALLAAAFLAHGLLLLRPPADIAVQMYASLPPGFWLFLGIAEVAAAIGLILPGVTRIMPGFVPAAAAGVTFVMISATIWHVVRGEISSAFITLVLLAMAAYVTYMRWKVLPIPPRSPAVSHA
jgi:hypothetical protein